MFGATRRMLCRRARVVRRTVAKSSPFRALATAASDSNNSHINPSGRVGTGGGGSAMRSVGANLPDAAARAAVAAWRRPHSPGPLTAHELEQFWDDGFVVKRDLFAPTDLAPAVHSVEALVDTLVDRLHAAGQIRDKCVGLGFYERLTRIEAQHPGTSVLLHKQGVLPHAIRALWGSGKLLDVAQQCLGPDIAGHPVWNLRVKTPQNEHATVPWHQDSAYVQPVAWPHLTVTAWVPLCDATVDNGCMQLMRRGHVSGRTALHTGCSGDTWYLDLSEPEMAHALGVVPARDVVTCPVPFGSVLFLNHLVPHRSLENRSGTIRWSLDLRWHRTGVPNGFYGLKESIPMRSGADPQLVPDWDRWTAGASANAQRTTAVAVSASTSASAAAAPAAATAASASADALSSVIAGPWMDQWPLTTHNKHTRQFLATAHGGAAPSTSWHNAN